MPYVTVAADISGALKKFGMVEAEAKKAISRAMTKTATTARAEAARVIKAEGYGVKIGLIKEALSIRRAAPDKLEAAVRAKGRPLALIHFGARQTKKGVTANVKHGRKLWPGAFIATVKNGHRGVFVHASGTQTGKRGHSIRNRRIIEKLGPSVPGMMRQRAVIEALERVLAARFPVALDQELNYLRSRGRV